jgi:hypothetical protein
MAHSLNFEVVAEGVETPAQLAFLRDLGCDFVQGYLASPAVDAEAFALLLARQSLLPGGAAHVEENRFLAALRTDRLDTEFWVGRLLAERAPQLALAGSGELRSIGELDVRATILVHLQWRARLEALIRDGEGAAMSGTEAASAAHCALGRWLIEQRSTPLAGLPAYGHLVRVHRAFHEVAGDILCDLERGRLAEARRRTRGLAFRESSHAVVIALIDLFIAVETADHGV